MATPADASENIQPTQISTTTILLVLATIFVVLRFWARHYVAATYGLDDWLIVAGLVSRGPRDRCAGGRICANPRSSGFCVRDRRP